MYQSISQRERNIFQRGRNAKWIKSAFEVEVRGRSVDKLQVRGEAKGRNHGFRERSSLYWMLVSIQASVSGSICQFLQIYACFDYVVINHQKGETVTNMAPFMPFRVILVID